MPSILYPWKTTSIIKDAASVIQPPKKGGNGQGSGGGSVGKGGQGKGLGKGRGGGAGGGSKPVGLSESNVFMVTGTDTLDDYYSITTATIDQTSQPEYPLSDEGVLPTQTVKVTYDMSGESAWLGLGASDEWSFQASCACSPGYFFRGDEVLASANDSNAAVVRFTQGAGIAGYSSGLSDDRSWMTYLQADLYLSGGTQSLAVAPGGWEFSTLIPDADDGSGNAFFMQAVCDFDSTHYYMGASSNDGVNYRHRIYKINKSTGDVDDSFDLTGVGTGAITGMDVAADGFMYLLIEDALRKVNLSTGSVVASYTGFSGYAGGAATIGTQGGTEYLIWSNYGTTTGAGKVYVVPLATITGAGSYTPTADETAIYTVDEKSQGVAWDSTNEVLYFAFGERDNTADYHGFYKKYSGLTLATDGAVDLRSAEDIEVSSVSRSLSDIFVDESTGEFYASSMGFITSNDLSGWRAVWKNDPDVYFSTTRYDDGYKWVHPTIEWDGSDVTVKLNNKLVATYAATSFTATGPIDDVAFGTGLLTGGNAPYTCKVKNLRIQDHLITDAEYARTIDDSTYTRTGATKYVATLTNAGAESGTTGWSTTGTSGSTSSSFNAYKGSNYFFGGANASADLYQELDLPTVTGLSQGELDSSDVWAVVSWKQSSYDNEDRAIINLEAYSSAPALLDSTTKATNTAAISLLTNFNESTGPNKRWCPKWNALDIPTSTKTLRVLIEFDRIGGTNLDGYVDDIQVEVYVR